MSIDVQWSNLESNEKSKRAIARQLRVLMWRFRSFVIRVRVSFSDVNGPRGGVDKRCIVSAKLRSPGEITIITEKNDFLPAFQASISRLIRAILREIVKQREMPIRINRRMKKIEQENANPQVRYGRHAAFAREKRFAGPLLPYRTDENVVSRPALPVILE